VAKSHIHPRAPLTTKTISTPVKRIISFFVLLLTATTAFAAEIKRPNIVFIFSDDHAYQAISAYGEARKLIETPNIDRIAKEGMRFDRCLVTNSICGPSRATILTGKYNHLNGYVNNSNMRFDGSQMTFPKLLQKGGYQTAIVGKWHLESDPTGFDFWQILLGQGVYYNPPMIKMDYSMGRGALFPWSARAAGPRDT
jgi:arylsulfatase A-like enzyme